MRLESGKAEEKLWLHIGLSTMIYRNGRTNYNCLWHQDKSVKGLFKQDNEKA